MPLSEARKRQLAKEVEDKLKKISAKERCVACGGQGKSSRGGVCYPCRGIGRKRNG